MFNDAIQLLLGLCVSGLVLMLLVVAILFALNFMFRRIRNNVSTKLCFHWMIFFAKSVPTLAEYMSPSDKNSLNLM